MRLTIVIPAFNEQEAIGSTIERCLAAGGHITSNSPVDKVDIVVVSDGSTDRTAEIAAGYSEIQLIVFDENRGYGAAIKRGFETGRGELVGFLDADGTCDPAFFATLCSAIIEEQACVAIGSRMGPQSHMPRVRRIGNRGYAFILSMLSNRVVTDTASGMRVIRRDALEQLYPLPDGLHFTPAMSARVLMDDALTIVEKPMSYEERIGDSKLHLLGDGLKFLHTILEMTLMWRPARLFMAAAAACLGLMVLFAIHPIEMWLRLGRLQEDMIYRLLFCSFLGTFGVTLLSAGVISDNISALLAPRAKPRSFMSTVFDYVYSFRGLGWASIVLIPILTALVGSGLWTRAAYGYVELHWSRVVLAGLVAFGLGHMLITILIANVLRFHSARRSSGSAPRCADRVDVTASGLRGRGESRSSAGSADPAPAETGS